MTRVEAFDFSIDLLRVLLWQYNDAARLQSLLEQKQAWYDDQHADFWGNWVRDVFDLRTANDFGLSVWAIILNIPLAIASPPDDPAKPLWAFGSLRENFGRGNLGSPAVAGLTTEQKRLVLRLRYFQLVTRGTVPEVNAFVGRVFANLGPVYVLDNLDMTATYVFGFPIPADLEQVLSEYDLLPRPAGVGVDRVVLANGEGWGFGRFRLNYDNGNFYHA